MSSEVIDAYRKSLLKTVFCNLIKKGGTSSKALAEELSVSSEYVDEVCSTLADVDMLLKSGGDWVLTELGRRQIVVVFTGGVFDIIHPGHLFTLLSANKLGDVLVVSVARDKTVKKIKSRFPLNNEKTRVDLVGSLRCVDLALLGSETDIFEVVERVRPDVIALGYDQKHDVDELYSEAKRRGLQIKVVRFNSPMPGIKSSSIIKNSEALREI
ncbi:MAG: adenylyltransferase/cytidyltransferase family protein [Nitrososphaerales archaeon]